MRPQMSSPRRLGELSSLLSLFLFFFILSASLIVHVEGSTVSLRASRFADREHSRDVFIFNYHKTGWVMTETFMNQVCKYTCMCF